MTQIPKATKHLMIIDDNEIDLYVSSMILERSSIDCKIVTKLSAMEAINYLNEISKETSQIPDLILLDINMPEMDGFGFLDVFGSMNDGIKNKTKIVMLTSSNDPGDIKRAGEYDYVKDYFLKPLNFESIQNLSSVLA